MRNAIGMLLLGLACGSFGSTGVRADETICFEAEAATNVVAPMAVGDAAQPAADPAWPAAKEASGNRYLEIPQGKGNPPEVKAGEAAWSFTLKEEGTYYLWCRVWWADSCGNSFDVSLDGAKPFIFGQDATYKSWHWVRSPLRLSQLELKAGTHALKIGNREDGVRVDQLLLTNDKRFVPVDIETVTAAGR